MLSNTAESAEPDQKICGCCKRLRAITDFRFENKAKGIRHRQCGHCRRERRQARRQRELRTTVRKGMHKMRRLQSAEALNNWLELLAYKVGGVQKFVDLWHELMTAKDLPLSYRTTALTTILHFFSVYEKTLAASSIVKSADDLKKLHKGQLIQWIRELRREGYLTIEHVDPSPGDWSGFDPH